MDDLSPGTESRIRKVMPLSELIGDLDTIVLYLFDQLEEPDHPEHIEEALARLRKRHYQS